MIVDALAFIGGRAGPDDGGLPGLLSGMSELGIDRTLVCGGKLADGESPNARPASAVRDHPGLLAGLIRLSPWMRDWAAELERYAGDPAFAGVLLHPWEDGFALLDPEPRRMVAASADRGLPVTVAAGYPWLSEAPQVGALAAQFPGATFVLTHEGQLNISGLGAADVTFLLDQAPNVFLHTTGAYREDFLVQLAARSGPGRLMYAGGYPRFSPAYELRRVQWADGITDDTKAQIQGPTAAAVFRLETSAARPAAAPDGEQA